MAGPEVVAKLPPWNIQQAKVSQAACLNDGGFEWGIQAAQKAGKRLFWSDALSGIEGVAFVGTAISCRLHGLPGIRFAEGQIRAKCKGDSRTQETLAAIEPGMLCGRNFGLVGVAFFINEVWLGDNPQFESL